MKGIAKKTVRTDIREWRGKKKQTCHRRMKYCLSSDKLAQTMFVLYSPRCRSRSNLSNKRRMSRQRRKYAVLSVFLQLVLVNEYFIDYSTACRGSRGAWGRLCLKQGKWLRLGYDLDLVHARHISQNIPLSHRIYERSLRTFCVRKPVTISVERKRAPPTHLSKETSNWIRRG